MITNMYATAKQRYDKVTPIRGTDIRPINNRRRKHEHMQMLGNGDIQFICYKTPVLTVHKDDSFSLAHGGYITTTTGTFLSFLLWQVFSVGYPNITAYKRNNQIWISQGGLRDHTTKLYRNMPLTKDPIRYVLDTNDGYYKPTQPVIVRVLKKSLNKVAAKDAYQSSKKFLDWLSAFSKLFDGGQWEVSYDTVLNREMGFYIRSPQCLGPKYKNYWFTRSEEHIKGKQWLEDTLKGDDPERFMQLVNTIYENGQCTDENDKLVYKNLRTFVLQIIKSHFACYETKAVDVEYKFDRKATW